MTLRFSDGTEFDTGGEPRAELRADGWYVVGGGMLMPASSQEDAERLLARMKSRRSPPAARTEG